MITQQLHDDVFVLQLAGEININSLNLTRQEVDACGLDQYGKVVIDLEKVSFFDSSGLGYLIVLIKQVRMKNGFIALCNPNALVKRLLSTIRIERYIGIHDSLEEAMRNSQDHA